MPAEEIRRGWSGPGERINDLINLMKTMMTQISDDDNIEIKIMQIMR